MRTEFELNRDVRDSFTLYTLVLNAKESMRRVDEMLLKQHQATQASIQDSLR